MDRRDEQYVSVHRIDYMFFCVLRELHQSIRSSCILNWRIYFFELRCETKLRKKEKISSRIPFLFSTAKGGA